ncbi:beta-1,3-galactosyltransferase 5-like [Leptidea sinapis]|uniref:beta-1,3-galactosyltransferase 5-like n=1 Tax=Leptidea sinapis TaxID=189913 RepID=UPI00212BCE67|nr:beta-1,3-galactosyltransferase 5-like [Leptidea sinapis]
MSVTGAGGAAGVRRSHALVLLALGLLLLMLLASHAPAPPARPAPAAMAPPVRSAPPSPPAPLATRTRSNHSAAASTSPPTNSSSSSSTVKAVSRAGAPLTGQLYAAGHRRPHPELCPALGARLRLLVLVTSAPAHAAARDAVRLTWGHYAARRDVAIAFVLGTAPDELRAAIDAEDALYGDVVVGNFVDAYSNLTLKTVSMLEWADTYCPRAGALLKTDDDMFINVPRLLRFAAARANASLAVWGRVIRKSLPKRTTKSKYFVSTAQFAGKVFPDFATGPAYLVSRDAVRPLLEAAAREPYLPLEDVFLTGIVAGKLGIKRHHSAEFYNKKVAAHPCAIQRAISIHMVQYHEQFDLWRKLLDGKTKCT